MIHYLPINIPRMNPIKWDGMKTSRYAWWNMVKITKETENRYDESIIKPEFLEMNPWFGDWLKHLPIKRLINIKLHMQDRPTDPHIDFNKPNENLDLYRVTRTNEPCGYRVVVKGSPKNVMYVIDDNGDKIYSELPYSTNTYAINHTQCIHGTEEDKDRCVMFFQFEVDKQKHSQIINQSRLVYKDYVITV